MSDKIKACCENCKMRGLYIFCDYFEYQKAICKRYDGDGQTPKARIAELEAENKKLDSENKRLWREIEELGNGTLAKKNYDMCIKCAKVFGEIAVSMDVSLENSTYQLMDILPQKTKEIVAENAELKTENQFYLDTICEITPHKLIARGKTPELSKELSMLLENSAKEKFIIIDDIRKLVKPLVWEYDEDDEIYSAPISMYGKYLQVSVFCEKMKSGYWRMCVDGIICDRKTPEEAKKAAQDWLVSLVANACGLESEVRNG